MCLSVRVLLVAVICLSGREWLVVMCLSGRGLMVAS
jgi:hypothetical protein